MIQRIRSFFNKLRGNIAPPLPEAELEALRVSFQERYHCFKLLLASNNQALQLMSEIQEALKGRTRFGMAFVRSHVTRISVAVYRMIQNLNHITNNKYAVLYERHAAIEADINQLMKSEPGTTADVRVAVALDDIDKHLVDLVGNKMAHLGEVRNQIGLRVPEGFVLTTAAYQRFLEHNRLQEEIDRRFQSVEFESMEERYALSSALQQLIIRAEVPDDIAHAFQVHWSRIESRIGKPVQMALRSSAIGEDEAGSSFAGQYRSELNVSLDNALQAYKEVLASKYSLAAISYRLNRGFRDEDIRMSVGCLQMVPSVAGGVVYSKNPVDSDDSSIIINSVWGLPHAVVDGSVACDEWVLHRKPNLHIADRTIRTKRFQTECLPLEGIRRVELDEAKANAPSLTDAKVLELAEIALAIEAHYATAQDIEWAIDAAGDVYILQSRPLRQLSGSSGKARPIPKIEDGSLLFAGGEAASPGSACGPVRIVSKGLDLLEFPEGAVLVVENALPRWASLMSRACAVVAEQGGIAGHLANVAREFGIPALFGATNMTTHLQNDQVVTVDATNGFIYRGKVDEVLVDAPQRPNLMAGSPIYELLLKINEKINPLHLLDPDSIDFRPENCVTLHDITRFIHETSVIEMFDFGKNHHFPERASKQLYYRVPMEWWIVNLDDGWKGEITGKYVRLEDIVCIPMLAFWKGFIAIPWDGPPALDTKGFMSVMFQSTTNPALVTGVKSAYAEKNYFMISRNFCSLNSRLGYHFSTLEAFIGERIPENYIRFQFKGGAADDIRRIRRVELIGEILESQGFRVEIRNDHLAARLEQLPMEDMIRHTEIIGYLTLHTRQIDMIMTNPSAVTHTRRKLLSDIEQLMLQPIEPSLCMIAG
ncbi:MAG: PEP/pyruvate-binding domain-containing protein [Thermodesulfobacteriota bacterium]